MIACISNWFRIIRGLLSRLFAPCQKTFRRLSPQLRFLIKHNPQRSLALLGSLVLIISLVPILTSIKRSQTSQATGLQLQFVSPRIGAITGGDKVILKGRDFQPPSRLTQISTSGNYSCAINSNSKVYCWGYNIYGQLGNNSTTNSSTPVAVHQGVIPSGVTLTHISLGEYHTCAFGSNGQAYCWGWNIYGQLGNNSTTNSSTPVAVAPGAIPAGVNLTYISAGGYHTCALGSNSKAYCWGNNNNGALGNNSTQHSKVPVAVSQGAIPAGVNLTHISTGYGHTCALGSNGKAYCWGNNNDGALGNNSTQHSKVPVAVSQGAIPAGVNLTHISTGYGHACTLASDYKVYCWGKNNYGQLGNNSTTSSSTPVAVAPGAIPAGVNLTQISADYNHTCALGSNGKAYCWGFGNHGQLGNNSTTSSSTPVAVAPGAIPSDTNLTHVSAGGTHTCALGSNGKAYCWGKNNYGQLGNNSTADSRTPVAVHQGETPNFSSGTTVKVDGVTVPVRYISSTELEITMPAHAEGLVNISVTNPDNSTHTLNQAYEYYQAKNPTLSSISPNTVSPYGGEIATLTGNNFDTARWRQISAGGSHTCALDYRGKAYCWGKNSYGRLGNNSTSDSSTPVAVAPGAIPAGVDLTQISAGIHTCTLASDFKAYCWGDNSSGQLGNNSTTNSSVPVAVTQGAIPASVNLTQISVGSWHTCALGSDSKAYCWGNGDSGQLGNNSTSDSSTPVAVSQGSIPAGINFTHISAGYAHTCALGSDHKAYCWGRNNSGQLGNGTGGNWGDKSLTPVAVAQGAIPNNVNLTQISTGDDHTCVLGSDSKAYCWGDNSSGQLGNNSTTKSLIPVAVAQGATPNGVTLTHLSAGDDHTCALGSNSKAYCWGRNNDGQLGNNSTTNSSTPVAVSQGAIPNNVNLTQISASHYYTCALGSNSKTYCWGEGENSQLGTGSTMDTKVPAQVTTGYTLKLSDNNSSMHYAYDQADGFSNTQLKLRTPAGPAGLKPATLYSHYLQLDSNPKPLTYALAQPHISAHNPNQSPQHTATNITTTGSNFTNLHPGDFTQVSASDSHTCALGSNNQAYCWGKNSSGQLGNNSTSDSRVPVVVAQGVIPDGITLTHFSTGRVHTCALGSNHKAYCWGSGGSGQLGNNSTSNYSTPVAVSQGAIPSGVNLTHISAGGTHTCALGSNGKAYCWGRNDYGQLGNGIGGNYSDKSLIPIAVSQGAIPSGVNLTQISAGYDHTCALGSNHKAYCWGRGTYGQLGNNSASDPRVPIAVVQGAIPAGVTLTQISAGDDHTCALGSNHKAYCWGRGDDGRLGNNSTNESYIPVAVAQGAIPNNVNLTRISAGSTHTCALGSDSKAYCWGNNNHGQLGNSSTGNSYIPVTVSQGVISSGVNLTRISAGYGHTCATGSNGQAYCWGAGSGGRLGNNWTIDRHSPTPVLMKTDPTITFGTGHLATNINLNVPENSYYTNTLTLTTPSRPAGQVPVSITNPDGQSNTTQADGQNNYTFSGPVSAPTDLTANPTNPLGSVTLSFKSPSTGGIDNQPNAGNNFDPITDYKIEYCIANSDHTACQDPANTSPTPNNPTNWTNHPHTALISTSTNPLTINIPNLNKSSHYLFRVAGINQSGTGNYAQTNATLPSYVSVSTTPTINLNITPIHTGTISTANLTIDYATNLPDGYSLTMKTATNQATFGNSPFQTISNQFPSSARLQPNQWGFRLPNITQNSQRNNVNLSGQSSNTQLVTNTNQDNHTDQYSAIPHNTSPNHLTISDYNSADTGQRQLIIGLNAAKTTPSGQYTETLVLTIVGH